MEVSSFKIKNKAESLRGAVLKTKKNLEMKIKNIIKLKILVFMFNSKRVKADIFWYAEKNKIC